MADENDDEKHVRDEGRGGSDEAARDAKGRFLGGRRSANPSGRPPKVNESVWEMVARVFNESMTFHEKGGKQERAAREGILKILRNKALSGDLRALALYLKLIHPELVKLEREHKAQEAEDAGYQNELRRRVESMAARWEAEQAAKKKADDEAAKKNGGS